MEFVRVKTDNWPFADSENTAVFTTRQVFDDGQPILYVSHDADDGAWQFHTGGTGVSAGDALVVCLKNVVELDPAICALADLPLGWIAERKNKGRPWERRPRQHG